MSQEVIETIFDNFSCLNKEYKDFNETRAADEEVDRYIEKNILFENEKMAGETRKERLNRLSDLVLHAGYVRGKQGFIYGFRYAVSLLINGGL